MFEDFTFAGRCSRAQYWLLSTIIIVSYNLAFIGSATLGNIDGVDTLATLMVVITAILHWSTIVRRTRDTGLNAWWCLLTIVPYFGILWLLLLGFFPSLKDDA